MAEQKLKISQHPKGVPGPYTHAFPAEEKFSWDNPLVGFTKDEIPPCFVFRDGTAATTQDQANDCETSTSDGVVRKVVVYGDEDDDTFLGAQFFDSDGQELVWAGDLGLGVLYEFALQEGERLLGVKCRLNSQGQQLSPVWVIGQREE